MRLKILPGPCLCEEVGTGEDTEDQISRTETSGEPESRPSVARLHSSYPQHCLQSVKSSSSTLLNFGLQHISIYIKIDIGNILYLLCICILDISRIGFCHLNMFLCQNVFSISYKITFPVQSLHCQSSVSLEKYISVRPKMQCFRPGSNRGPSVC